MYEKVAHLVLSLLKKQIRLGHASIVDLSVDLLIPALFVCCRVFCCCCGGGGVF